MEISYSAGLMSQSFWFIETRKILNLIHEGKSEQEIKDLCLNHNLFGAAKEYRAKRMYGYIHNRTEIFDNDLLEIFCKSDLSTQKIINLIAVMKTDKLFFEFMFEVYREKALLGYDILEKTDVNVFFNNKEVQCPEIAQWAETTKRKLGNVYLNFLLDANMLTMVDKQRKITPPILDTDLTEYLKRNGNRSIMRVLTGEN